KVEKKYNRRKGSISPSSRYEELVLSRVLHGRENYYKSLAVDKYSVEERYLGPYSKDRREWLQEFFNDVFQALPKEEYIKFGDYIPKLINLIEKYVSNLNKYDGTAQDVILKTLEKIEAIDM